jgi:PIN domain nuclease of toxin-antitoxin system
VTLLLDTHAFLWWLNASPRLGRNARAAIAEPGAFVFVSAASAWEMAVKRETGRLDSPADVAGAVVRCGFSELSITIAHAVESAELPWHHRDPFDRLLIAQARLEDLTLVAHDERFRAYDVELLDAAA